MAKFILIDKNTGFALRNLPGSKWNDGTQKTTSFWTFAGPDRPASIKALEMLAAKGFTNVEFQEMSAEAENAADKTAENASVSKGDKAPRNIEEAVEIHGSTKDDVFFQEINHKCVGCTKNCKQSSKATIYQCPAYTKKAAA